MSAHTIEISDVAFNLSAAVLLNRFVEMLGGLYGKIFNLAAFPAYKMIVWMGISIKSVRPIATA